MKTEIAAAGLAVGLIVAVSWEEMRIQDLRKRLAEVEKVEAVGPPAKGGKTRISSEPFSAAPGSKGGPRGTGTPREEREGESGSEEFATSVRKMFENPAGKAMRNETLKIVAAGNYGPLMEEFGLNEKEKDYFLNLVGGGLAAQQEVGMKMLSATTDEEREAIVAEVVAAQEERKKTIGEFLNSEEDFERFTDYEARLPERQQIGGIRAVMGEAGVPMTTEQEGQLMDAMFEVRTDSGITEKREGANGIEGLLQGNAVEQFEQNWSAMQTALNSRVSDFLTAEQVSAFQAQQEQVRELQVAGMRMAEQLMRGAQQEE